MCWIPNSLVSHLVRENIKRENSFPSLNSPIIYHTTSFSSFPLFLYLYLFCLYSHYVIIISMREQAPRRAAMKNTIRCCISCILPCGALDVIRVVHSNGRVEEFSQSVRASEIMKAHPKHVLRKPTSGAADEGIVPKIVVVPPDAELQRGKIYFLIPVASSPSAQSGKNRKSSSTTSARKKIKKREVLQEMLNNNSRSPSSTTTTTTTTTTRSSISMTSHLLSDQYLTEILSENRSTQMRDRKRGRVAVWRPHLESISETEY